MTPAVGMTFHYEGGVFQQNGEITHAKDLSHNTEEGKTDPSSSSPKEATQTEKLKTIFGELSALAAGFSLQVRHRTGFLSQVAFRAEEYQAHPIENPNLGGDQSGLLVAPPEETATHHKTMLLFSLARVTAGKGKVFNEIGNPLKEHNKKGLSGEFNFFDIMHAPLWHTGISIASSLNSQGYRYVACPENTTPDEFAHILKELESGHFSYEGNDHIQLHNMDKKLKLSSFSGMEIILDPDSPHASKLSITFKDQKESKQPSGFIIHPDGGLMKPEHTEALFKAMRTAKGGFYKLNEREIEVLSSGLATENTVESQAFLNQVPTFNAMYPVYEVLERQTGFSAVEPTRKAVGGMTKRSLKAAENPDLTQDILTGERVTEMMQPLRITQPKSKRPEMPSRFLRSYSLFNNFTKAMVHAFDMRDEDKQPIFEKTKGQDAYDLDPQFETVVMNGKLKDPNLKKSKYTAALISTAILVSEELIVETLARNALSGKPESAENRQVLEKILGADHAARFLDMARGIDIDRLGVQYKESDPLVDFVRETLDTDKLISFADKISTKDSLTPDTKTLSALRKLEKVGNILQGFHETSGESQGSRGINAGLSLALDKLSQNSRQTSFIQSLYDQATEQLSISMQSLSPFRNDVPPIRDLKKHKID